MKKNLFVLIVIALIASALTSAYSPMARKTGCLPNGSYIFAFAPNDGRVYWWKMSAGLIANLGFFDLGIGYGYSADGKFAVNRCSLVFSLISPEKHSDLYRTSVTGKWLTNLTKTENLDEVSPWFSPDGQHILFTVYDENNKPSVVAMDRNGFDQTVIAKDTSAGPTFSWWVSKWSQYNDGFATNLRAAAMRPEGNLVAVITREGDLEVVPIDPLTYMPMREPTRLMVGGNLSDVQWVNIPYYMPGTRP